MIIAGTEMILMSPDLVRGHLNLRVHFVIIDRGDSQLVFFVAQLMYLNSFTFHKRVV